MNILYIHGLESLLSEQKRLVIEEYGKVFSPELNYKTNKNCYKELTDIIKTSEIDILIGSSMGGFQAYYLSKAFNKPALIFNPALPYRSIDQEIKILEFNNNPFRYIVLGRADNVIKYEDNIDFLNKNIKPDENIEIKIINKLEHRIPFEILKKEVFNFFHNLNKISMF